MTARTAQSSANLVLEITAVHIIFNFLMQTDTAEMCSITDVSVLKLRLRDAVQAVRVRRSGRAP